MAEYQTHLRTANGLRCYRILFDSFHEHLAAHQACIHRDKSDTQGDYEGHEGGAKDRHNDQGQDKTRKGEQHIHHAHDQVIHLPPQEPRYAANERPHDERTADYGYGNTQVITAAVDDTCEDIASILIEPEE